MRVAYRGSNLSIEVPPRSATCRGRAQHLNERVEMAQRTCTVDENGMVCGLPVNARDMCPKHYARWLQHGDPLILLRHPVRPCVAQDCQEMGYGELGLCAMHRRRTLKHGDPLLGGRAGPVAVRRDRFASDEECFLSRLTMDGPLASGDLGCCWPWLAGKAGSYGAFYVDGVQVRAHIWAYEHWIGPVPEGMQLDHVCHNIDDACMGGKNCPHRLCVNPYHLEAVPPRTNLLRGKGLSADNARKTHCPEGHEYDEANTIHSCGRRTCKTCKRLRYAEKKAAEQR